MEPIDPVRLIRPMNTCGTMRRLDDLQRLGEELIAEARMLRERCELSKE
jgi:hypothetical protein